MGSGPVVLGTNKAANRAGPRAKEILPSKQGGFPYRLCWERIERQIVSGCLSCSGAQNRRSAPGRCCKGRYRPLQGRIHPRHTRSPDNAAQGRTARLREGLREDARRQRDWNLQGLIDLDLGRYCGNGSRYAFRRLRKVTRPANFLPRRKSPRQLLK